MLSARAAASTIAPGLYEVSGKAVYVGIEHELPDPATNDFFEPATGRIGPVASTKNFRLRCAMHEVSRVLEAPQGRLGASLYYRDERARATVLFVHGADAETREVGFIVPYFVCNGINVISYDQRGVGSSIGNWFLTGPIQKAEDVAAVYDAFSHDPHVDMRKIGVFGFSNGGWVAPLVTLRRPTAFMILKSAPTESILSNIDYEVTTELRRHHIGDPQIARALGMWHTVEGAIYGRVAWSDANRALNEAKRQSWFQYSLMPKLGVPPPAATVAGLRRAFSYDPSVTLMSVTTPTLALYGSLDRRVDTRDASAHLREYLGLAGARDVTIKVFPHAGHTLVVSDNGYDPEYPERYVPGYPAVMLQWLRARRF